MIRKYKPGDEENIIKLVSLVWPKQSRIDYWEWINKLCPFGNTLIQVAENNNKEIIGHYAILPVDIFFNGKNYKSGLAIDAITHPSYRSLKLIYKIAHEIWAQAVTNQIQFIFGFPNNNIWEINKNLMNWEELSAIKTYKIDIDSKSSGFSINDGTVKIMNENKFDSRYNLFFEIYKNENIKNHVIMKTDKDYLNWRYKKHPLNDYTIFERIKDNALIGYIVLKVFEDSTKNKVINVVEIKSLRRKFKETISQLLYRTIDYAKTLNLDILTIWLPMDAKKRRILRAIGFYDSLQNTNFGYRSINNQKIILNQNVHWDIDMFMSDVY